MKPMKLVAGMVVALLLSLGAVSAHAKVDEAGSKASTETVEGAIGKCPPFC